MIGIGVEARRKAAAGNLQFTSKPADRLIDASTKQRIFSRTIGKGESAQEQAVVVQHLLKMRHFPFRIGGVAREATPKVVVYAALAEKAERGHDRRLVFKIPRPQKAAPKQFKNGR